MARNKVIKTSKMIALVSFPNEMKAVFDQLRARNVQVFPVTSLESAMKILESGAVDYCLLSVDHSKIDIYELPQKIETEQNTPVIAISELRDKQSMWRLTKVKTKNILYSKASAQNIYSRIEIIRKAQQDSATKSAQLAVAAKTARHSQKRDDRREELKAETRRKQEVDARKNNIVLLIDRPPESKVRLLTAPRPQELGSVRLNSETKFTLPPVTTKFTEIKSGDVKKLTPLIRADRHQPVLVAHSDDETGRAFFDRDVDYKKSSSLLMPARPGESIGASDILASHPSEEALRAVPVVLLAPPEDMQKAILGCLKNALGEFCNPNELTQKVTAFNRSMVISVNSKNLVGTFIISAENELPKLGDVQTQLYDYLRTFGFDWQQDEIKVELLTDQKVPIELITSGVYVAGATNEGEVAISYYTEAVKVPELGLTNSTQHVIDPRNLVKDTRLNFDIFLHLKVNSRDLQYVKVGSNIDQKQINKLKASGLTPWVPRNQLSNLNEYVLLQRLLKLMNPDALDEEIEDLLKIS